MAKTEAKEAEDPENSDQENKKDGSNTDSHKKSTGSEEENESWENFQKLAGSVLGLTKEQVEEVRKKSPLPPKKP